MMSQEETALFLALTGNVNTVQMVLNILKVTFNYIKLQVVIKVSDRRSIVKLEPKFCLATQDVQRDLIKKKIYQKFNYIEFDCSIAF